MLNMRRRLGEGVHIGEGYLVPVLVEPGQKLAHFEYWSDWHSRRSNNQGIKLQLQAGQTTALEPNIYLYLHKVTFTLVRIGIGAHEDVLIMREEILLNEELEA